MTQLAGWVKYRGRKRDREREEQDVGCLLTALGRQHEEELLPACLPACLLLTDWFWCVFIVIVMFPCDAVGQLEVDILVEGSAASAPVLCLPLCSFTQGFIWSAHWMGKHFNLIGFIPNALIAIGLGRSRIRVHCSLIVATLVGASEANKRRRQLILAQDGSPTRSLANLAYTIQFG